MGGDDGHDKGTAGAARRPFRVTSFDVAAEAGVSQSTVSRALAGDPVVSEATRNRVVEAARRLNYHVDENAARLRTGRTGTLAVVVVGRPGENLRDYNPFYYALLGSICAAAAAHGRETLVSFQDRPERLWGRYQEQRKADGLIVIGTTENRAAWDHFAEIAADGADLVCWGSPLDSLDWIRSDNDAGARAATRHLIDQGWRQIACIGSEVSPQRQFKERYDGYAATMAEAGRAPRLFAIEEGLPREEQGRRAAQQIIAAGGVDAVFAVCDEIALGALHVLAEAGIAVGPGFGLVGFDGIRAGFHARPALTSVEPLFEDAGTMLVERLLQSIDGQPGEKRRVPVQLVVRESSLRAP